MRRIVVALMICSWPVAAGLAREPGQRSIGAAMPYSVGRALPDRSGEWVRAAQIQMFNPGDSLGVHQRRRRTVPHLRLPEPGHDEVHLRSDPHVRRGRDLPHGRSPRRFRHLPAGSQSQGAPRGARRRGAGEQQHDQVLARRVLRQAHAPARRRADAGARSARRRHRERARGGGHDAGGGGLVPGRRPGAGLGQVHTRRRPRQAAFTHAFEAKYQSPGEPSTAMVVPFDSDTAAAAALARYESFLAKAKGKTKLTAPGNGGSRPPTPSRDSSRPSGPGRGSSSRSGA